MTPQPDIPLLDVHPVEMSVNIHLRQLQRWSQSIARYLSPLPPQLSTFTHASSYKNCSKFKSHSCLPLSALPLTLCRLDSETNQSFPLSAQGNLLLILQHFCFLRFTGDSKRVSLSVIHNKIFPFIKRWKWKLLSHLQLFANPRVIQSMEFSRPEYWSG